MIEIRTEKITPEIKQLEENLKKLRCYLFYEYPFWGTITANVKIVISEEFPIAATDCHSVIHVNPVCATFSKNDLKFVVLHELLHIAFMHSQRRGKRNPHIWNIACDYAINSILIDEMRIKPELDPLYNPEFRKKSAEEIYRLLMDRESTGMGINLDLQEKNNEGQGKETCENNGEGEDGRKNGLVFSDDLIPSKNPREEIEKVKGILTQAHIMQEKFGNKLRGTIPGSVYEFVKRIIEPKIPFERLVARYVSEYVAGKSEYSFCPVNRKMAVLCDVAMPSVNKAPEPKTVLAIDTSGSITPEDLEIFAGAIKKLSTIVEELHVITCDYEIQQVIKPGEIDKFLKNIAFRGRGGTSHIPVFEYIDKHIKNVDLVICFTDGYTDYPEKKPKYPVIWILTPTHREPPWGKKIVIDTTDYEI